MNGVHEQFARRAIELARQARAAGNHPFGALLVLDGEIIALLDEAREVHLGLWFRQVECAT